MTLRAENLRSACKGMATSDLFEYDGAQAMTL